MRSTLSSVAAFALVAACATAPHDKTRPPAPAGDAGPVDPGGGSGSGTGSGSSSGGGGPSCSLLGTAGTFAAADPLGPCASELSMSVAIDAAGDLAVARSGGGIEVLAPDLHPRFALPVGSLVAFDASGNLFVAGSFTQKIQIGSKTLVPSGNVDVFLAELDPQGNFVSANALGQCGADLDAIAVDRGTGRVALSGSAMGTIVLDPTGKVVFTRYFAGKLAFDSQGNLIIAGNFNTQIDFGTGPYGAFHTQNGFVVKYDSHGTFVAAHIIAPAKPSGTVDLRALAVGPDDEIVFGGNFTGSIILDGRQFDEAVSDLPATRGETLFDTFLVKLDANLDFEWVEPPAIVGRDLNGIAVAASGNIVVTGDDLGVASGTTFTNVVELLPDGSGPVLGEDGAFPTPLGHGLAVATNACGAIFVGAQSIDPAGDAMRAMLYEIAP